MKYFDQIAQSVVEQVSSILNIPIILTDKTGIIIGSTDIKKLGLRHHVAVQVTKSGEKMSFSKERVEKYDDVLPGIAIPLHFQQQTVGMLGLIGDPVLIERYVEFVQAHIEMLIMESFRSSTVALQMETMRDFMHRILSFNRLHSTYEIQHFSKTIGFELNLTRQCILLEIPLPNNIPTQQGQIFSEIERDLFLYLTTLFIESKKDIIAPLKSNQWVVLKHVNTNDSSEIKNKLEFVIESLTVFLRNRELPGEVRIFYGDCYSTIEGISQSCEQAVKASSIASRNNWKKQIVSTKHWELLSLELLEEVKLPSAQSLEIHFEMLNVHPNCTALTESFLVYCEELMNVSQAAKKLYIHRNTLIYRLQQLQQLLNIDFDSFDQCMLLYLALRQLKIEKKIISIPSSLV